ncbi:hypothetical protein ABWL39_20895 [Chitinivorax sp. PXF-14]|uniref:hypothetical protein n=1 Tax=Chitinivorax sp. PXF-14 TaxID=3230488 RepID=UPI0034655847
MKRRLLSILALVGMSAHGAENIWPPLPTTGFIAGRSATKSDVANGNAVFVAARGEVSIGKPLPVAVPQYVWFKDQGHRKPAILIQAEEADGKPIYGARLLDGSYVAGFGSDFDLLGKAKPNGTAP